jgi:16S rRNA (guanine527-N7)-methyltransferase
LELILKYFPDLTERQQQQFEALGPLYEEWNARINVVSRKDTDELYLRHVLHSLAIARTCSFAEGARILDVGTGGGFPAIPLAIMFPEAHFTAVDSIGKKIRVVEEVVKGTGLTNVSPLNGRAENAPGRFDHIVSRAVAPAVTVLSWVWSKTDKSVLLLKGGDLDAELAETGRKYKEYSISAWFDEPFFETKKVVCFSKMRNEK